MQGAEERRFPPHMDRTGNGVAMKVVILAGGFGTRLRPITLSRPKALLPIAGEPILHRILADPGLPSRPLLVINRRFSWHFERWLATTSFDVDLLIDPSEQEEGKLGSIGALLYAIGQRDLDDDLLVIGGDNVLGFSVSEMLRAYRGVPLIALYDAKDVALVAGRYGVGIVRGRRMIDFEEKPEHPRSTLASTACYIYPASCIPLLSGFRAACTPRRDAPGHFNAWLLHTHREPVDAFVFGSYWHDIGDRASYLQANLCVSGRDCWIAPSTVVVKSQISNSIVLDGGRVERCRIDGCVIGADCRLSHVSLTDELIADGTTLLA
jgi:glucose-1-phosphate thymidylyltransferase